MKRSHTFALIESDLEILRRIREKARFVRNNSEVVRLAIHSLAELSADDLKQKFIQFMDNNPKK